MTDTSLDAETTASPDKIPDPVFATSKSGRERVASSIYENYLLGKRSLFLIGLPGVGKTRFLRNLPGMVAKRWTWPLVFVYIDIVRFFMRRNRQPDLAFSSYFEEKLNAAMEDLGLSPVSLDAAEGDLKSILSRIPETDKDGKDLLRAVVLDHVDGVGPELLEDCSPETMTEFQMAIRELKFFCPQLGITLLCCGNRHYHIARRDFQRDMETLGDGAYRADFETKYKGYLQILQTSIYRMDILYLTGLNVREIDALCHQYFPKILEREEEDEKRDRSPITRLAREIKNGVGNHPEMVVMLLRELYNFRRSVEGKPAPELLLESVVLQLRPSFWNIFERIWKNEALEGEVDFLRAIAAVERIDDATLKMICNEFSEKTDMPASFFRAKLDTWESHGLFCPIFRGGPQGGRVREFFSHLFREFIQLREMAPAPPAVAASARPPVLTVREEKEGWRLFFDDEKVDLSGRLAVFFGLLWAKRDETLPREDLANQMEESRAKETGHSAQSKSMAALLNSLYQLKRRLAERLAPIPVIQLVSVSGEGYRLEVEPGVEIEEAGKAE